MSKRLRDSDAPKPPERSPPIAVAAAWGWVGDEATDPAHITSDHLLATCGMSSRNAHRFCRNKHTSTPNTHKDEIIVISDEDEDDGDAPCTKKSCKNNPNCLNHFNQKKWESEEDARELFMEVAAIGDNPADDKRRKNVPVGLKNLGATCYANASLQVWFRDLAFRRGVYACEPTPESSATFKDSPTFQLQFTFAALQCTTQDVFNPEKLVKSLELETSEQQDAQEFSKLFMSHLDAEFQKQSNPTVKTLIRDQFQGKQVFGTICSKCNSTSSRDEDFLEIEIAFKNNTKLEEGIANLLQEESLSGDNRYLCSVCASLQDATRFTELASLPPVVHFSLQRFSYNFTTMERVKSKNTITFPKTLDMGPFMGNVARRKAETTSKSDANLYELRGVLLHKGKSAYHGHYEAQILDDATSSWYQFNDEEVKKIKKLGDKLPTQEVIEIDDDENKPPARSRQREDARKRQRIDDSDEEPPPKSSSKPTSDYENRIASKEAYMLIYARKESCAPLQDPEPPASALAEVNELNALHSQACDAHAEKEKATLETFAQTRRTVLDIFRSWNVSQNDQDFVIVSQKALEEYTSQTVIKSAVAAAGSEPQNISLSDVLCRHNRYDHTKANAMKRISLNAYNKIKAETNCVLSPELTLDDVCRECVEEKFHERLYAKQHPQLVDEFDRVSSPNSDRPTFWISKPWLKDWRLKLPKMHTPTGDPSPGSEEYLAHVQCEHSGLSHNQTQRCRISSEGVRLLQKLYPSWQPLAGDLAPCLVCDGLLHMGAEERLEVRRRAEEEKNKFKKLSEYPLEANDPELRGVDCALVPASFVRSWRSWLSRPSENLRPDAMETAPFFCEHKLLAFDPNCEADMETFAIVRRTDWDALEQIYRAGPLIAITKLEDTFKHEIGICTGCREQRKTNWDSTEIVIRSSSKDQVLGKRSTTKPVNGFYAPRQSTRLRQAKETTKRTRMTVVKATTVKEIKIHVQKELKIPTICQRLFYENRELDDNAVTVGKLNIFANSIIELREENEVHEISDSDDAPKKRRKPEESAGFGKTLLGRSNQRASSPMRPPTPPPAPEPRACSRCTFVNEPSSEQCAICEAAFA
ncbi:hypothetical protein MKEN_01212200 [Mycena kentingensis (nom. inval.)]|nr:hypothetical protein MKEN_01212200 [Mycena kentingensis (nom. inval.)]